MALPGDIEIIKLLDKATAKEVFRYLNGQYVGKYWCKEIVYRGQRIIQDLIQTIPHISSDKCSCCGWSGLSTEVKGDTCPRCGSTDMTTEDNV